MRTIILAGCVAFQMPTANKPAKFQFAPNSGFGDSFGEWQIP